MGALRDAQGVNGGIGDTVPIISLTGDRGTNFPQSPTWEGAVAQTPWQLYPQYGDTQVIRENMPTIKAWLDSYRQRRGAAPRLPGTHQPDVRQRRPRQHGQQHRAAHGGPGDVPALARDLLEDGQGRGRQRRTPQTLRQRFDQGKESFNRLYVDPKTGFTQNATPGTTGSRAARCRTRRRPTRRRSTWVSSATR